MKKLIAMLGMGLLFGTAAACGDKVCEKAAKRYTECVEETLGKEAAKMARAKEKAGIEACKKDKKTQKMYKKCLPEKTCDKFMKCILSYAAKHGP